MTEFFFKAALSYLLGSLMGGLIVGRMRGGVDIRELGSGNAGGTNALRTLGKMFAFWVLLIDVAKGFVATRLIAPLGLPVSAPASPMWRDWLPALCGIAVIVGHIYPIWYGFRGGKGAATFIGALLGIEALLIAPVLLVWLVVVALSGYVGLASIAAAVSLPVVILSNGFEPREPLLAFALAVATLVVFTHRANIARMRAGTEPRAHRLWLLGRIRG